MASEVPQLELAVPALASPRPHLASAPFVVEAQFAELQRDFPKDASEGLQLPELEVVRDAEPAQPVAEAEHMGGSASDPVSYAGTRLQPRAQTVPPDRLLGCRNDRVELQQLRCIVDKQLVPSGQVDAHLAHRLAMPSAPRAWRSEPVQGQD